MVNLCVSPTLSTAKSDGRTGRRTHSGLQQRHAKRHAPQEYPRGERGEDRAQRGAGGGTNGNHAAQPPSPSHMLSQCRLLHAAKSSAAHDAADDSADERDCEGNGDGTRPTCMGRDDADATGGSGESETGVIPYDIEFQTPLTWNQPWLFTCSPASLPGPRLSPPPPAPPGFIAAELKGDYKVEFVVNEASYTGTAKTTPAGKGAFTAKFDFTSPSPVTADATGKTAGDSVTFDAKYRTTVATAPGPCMGKGTVEKDGSKAAGAIAIQDSCDGEASGTLPVLSDSRSGSE